MPRNFVPGIYRDRRLNAMAVIGFSDQPEQIWCKAGWVFRQVIDDVLSHHPYDPATRAKLDQARAIKGLNPDRLEAQLASNLTEAIRDVITRILAGEIRSGIHEQTYGDEITVMQYHRSLRELQQMIPPRNKTFHLDPDGGSLNQSPEIEGSTEDIEWIIQVHKLGDKVPADNPLVALIEWIVGAALPFICCVFRGVTVYKCCRRGLPF
jgi:hypothetical protein